MFSLLLLSSLFIASTAALCQCGFSVNSTTSPQHQVFTEYIETDFTQNTLSGWRPQEYNVTSQAARGPYGKLSSPKNVIPSTQGLQLWVRSKAVDNMIPMAEVDSTRLDMLYGSFRVRAKMTGVNGTCGAFFWFHNNTQEIDMEFLSKQYNETDSSPVNLVIQSPASQAMGYNAMYTPGYDIYTLPFRGDSDFHEYRFDWTPDRIAFYADNKLLRVFTENIPDSGGHIVLNHWSNGDPGWSAGPPSQDTPITISHAHMYFNSSDLKQQQKFSVNCPKPDATKICTIKDDISTALMPPASTASPGSNSGGGHHSNVAYIIVGVVIGVVILLFICCMITVRHWAGWRRKLFGGAKRSNNDSFEHVPAKSESLPSTPDVHVQRQLV